MPVRLKLRVEAGTFWGVIVMVKVQLVKSPQASLATVDTVVVPMGNGLPLDGKEASDRGELHPP